MPNPFWSQDDGSNASDSPSREGHRVVTGQGSPVGHLSAETAPYLSTQQQHDPSADLMVDPLIDRYDVTFLLRKNFAKFLIAPVICAALAFLFYLRQEPLYESSALLMVDSSLDQLLQFQPTGQGSEHIQESLKSLEVAVVADSVVRRVVDRLDLRNEPNLLPKRLADTPNLQDTELFHFLREKRIQASLQPETRLIKISVFDPQPERARLIATTFVEEFEGFLADQRKSEAMQVKAVVESQVAEARAAALAGDARLKAYQETNSSLPLDQDDTLFSARLSQLGEDLNSAVRSRVDLESINESVREIDPNTNPIDVIEIADYQGVSHVSSLMSSLGSSKSRLAIAAERYTETNPSYLAAKAEVDRNHELIREQAAEIKSTLNARYNAATTREQLIKKELTSLQKSFIEMKAKSSEFRALQAESENEWLLYQNLQKRLSETIMSTELPGSIATVVSEPLTPFIDSRPPVALFVVVGVVLGGLISGVWILIKVFSGLPFSNSRQLEERLGLPVIADWSAAGKSAPGAPSPALVQTINAHRAQTIQISAPGLNGQGESIAETIAHMAASSGKKTLLLLIKPDVQQTNIQQTGTANLHSLVISPDNAMDESAFPEALSRFRQLYEKIIIESGSINDSSTVAWISHFADQDVVVVGRGAINKSEIATRVRSLYRPNSAPVALILVDPSSSSRKRKSLNSPDRNTRPAIPSRRA